MVVNNSGKVMSFRSWKLHFLLVRLYLILLVCPSATPLTFEFPSFNQNDIVNISREGDAFIDNQFLLLTGSAQDQKTIMNVGRATYNQPFLLREKSTGKLSDFTTSFSFSIYGSDHEQASNAGAAAGLFPPSIWGLTFFIAPNGSCNGTNNTLGHGAGLGLPSDHQFPFVAVEFIINQTTQDTSPGFQEFIEDPTRHVGIDVNTVKSLTTKLWNSSEDGHNNNVTIIYNSSLKNLSVKFTTFVNGTQQMDYLSYNVDLIEYLSDWVIVGFSASTGLNTSSLHKIISWSFSSTPLVVDDESKTVNTTAVSEPSSSGGHKGLVVGLAVGASVIIVGGLALVSFIFWKKKEGTESNDEDSTFRDAIDEEFEQGTGPRKFTYGELVRATGNFPEEEKLGQGGFGGVYRGFINDLNSYVAVKRISRGSTQGIKEYATEVRIISRLRHRNLVKLIGWCHKKEELLLVYEFMPNCSLDSHLFKEKSLLTWETRYKIAQGLAFGLLYLHEGWEQCVLHRDIKSSNVMLDSDFNAKLGDFGLARLVDHGKQSHTTVLAGTMGYMAPECLTTGKASKKTDVYSFGVVSLEIACGRKPIDLKLDANQINIVEWVWKLYGQGKVIEAADAKLCGNFDQKQVECLLIVGLWCVHPDYITRPSIQQAIQVLNFEVPLPTLPSSMPVATYSAPSVSFSQITQYL